jgi:RNA polymerase sigma-70 factor, ECF subfamily
MDVIRAARRKRRIPRATACVLVDMNTDTQSQENLGSFDARYLAFLETVTELRPSLHRYCSRMTGSVMDGEDVVQEALLQAYRKLDTYDESQRLKPWLFRVAHNRCIDFLRRRKVRKEAESVVAAEPDWVKPVEPHGRAVVKAVEHLVLGLPPMERACVLLKDVFDYSLEEIAELVDSTVGGVKAALSRGRSKLARLAEPTTAPRPKNEEMAKLLLLYVDRFNRHDWDGLRQLIAADARLTVADAFLGPLSGAPYFSNYERRKVSWKMTVGEVDGEMVIVQLHHDEYGWKPKAFIRLDVVDGQIHRIADYAHCPWVLRAAASIVVNDPAPN